MADVATKTVEYSVGAKKMRGFLAVPQRAVSPLPAVMVMHEFWGLNDYIKSRVKAVAELGYVAFGADLYGNGVTYTELQDANNAMEDLLRDKASVTDTLKAAFDHLALLPEVDGDKIAAIGYCLGGAMALHCARKGFAIKGAVSFHGDLTSFHKPSAGELKARVLAFHGGADKFISDEQVSTFKKEMDEAQADYKFVIYGGAVHAFTNPNSDANGARFNMPLAYNERADHDSWNGMRDFLAEIF